MDKVIKYLCRHSILDIQQCPVEAIDIGLYSTFFLGTLGPLILYTVGSINGHKLLLEEDF